jgi:hypothetical protein
MCIQLLPGGQNALDRHFGFLVPHISWCLVGKMHCKQCILPTLKGFHSVKGLKKNLVFFHTVKNP